MTLIKSEYSPSETDDVIQEIDVYLSKDLTDLFLLQFPLRQEQLPEDGIYARFKSQSEMLELLIPINTESEFYSASKDVAQVSLQKSDIWSQHTPGFQHLNSIKVPLKSNYFVGLFKDDKFFLSPLKASIQLRPSLRNVDQLLVKENSDTIESGIQQEKTKALQVQFRKKESHAEAFAKLRSYAYLQKLIDEESWSNFEFFKNAVGI